MKRIQYGGLDLICIAHESDEWLVTYELRIVWWYLCMQHKISSLL